MNRAAAEDTKKLEPGGERRKFTIEIGAIEQSRARWNRKSSQRNSQPAAFVPDEKAEILRPGRQRIG